MAPSQRSQRFHISNILELNNQQHQHQDQPASKDQPSVASLSSSTVLQPHAPHPSAYPFTIAELESQQHATQPSLDVTAPTSYPDDQSAALPYGTMSSQTASCLPLQPVLNPSAIGTGIPYDPPPYYSYSHHAHHLFGGGSAALGSSGVVSEPPRSSYSYGGVNLDYGKEGRCNLIKESYIHWSVQLQFHQLFNTAHRARQQQTAAISSSVQTVPRPGRNFTPLPATATSRALSTKRPIGW